MATEILLQILYSVLIVAGIVLIAVLWRAFEVLSDFKEISFIISKRAKEIDQTISQAKNTIATTMEAVKGFVYSLGIVKTIRNAMDNKQQGE